MMQELRDGHFNTVKVVMVGLPVLFVSGLIARSAPINPAPATQVFQSRPLQVLWVGSDSFRADGVKISLRRSEGGEYVQLESKDAIYAGDLFAYWSPEAPVGNEIPAQARLLGAFLPERAEIYRLMGEERGSGQIWLYSLAHERVLGTVANRK